MANSDEEIARAALRMALAAERHWNETTLLPYILAAIRDARRAGRRDGLEQAAQLLQTESFLMRHEYARAIRALSDD